MNKKRLMDLLVMKKKPKVLIIGTGGTISAKLKNGIYNYGEITQEDVINLIPDVRKHVDIETTNIFRMDSSDMTPENWITLANAIYHKMQDYDGIVITIGMDTLHYADTAISFLIQNNNIPIVFTSALYDMGQLNTDAKRNMRNAITVAGFSDIAETVLVFNSNIFRATRTKKINASEFNAFKEASELPLGKIEEFIKFNKPYQKRSKKKAKLYTSLETDIALIKVYPGFDGNRIKQMVDLDVKGIVLEGFGLGNIPVFDNNMKEAIKYANKKNIPIVITSGSFMGKYWRELYKPDIGNRLKGMDTIPAYDMLPETAYVKLMWVLAQTRDFEQVKKMMQKNYVGEISDDIKLRNVL
ncbi:MAG TPA: asparaginase [archaeon]|nr:asparaginase [archaeon]